MSLYKDASLVMIPSAYKDGKLYSIRPTDGSGDFTFSRGSNLAATRVDVNGLIEKGRENVLLQSNQFDTTWTQQSVALTSGQSGYDGSNNAWLVTKSGANGQVNQTLSTNGVNTFSCYAKAGTSNWLRLTPYDDVFFDLSTGVSYEYGSTTIDSAIESIGSGWYRCSITYNATSTLVRIIVADSSSSSSGTSGSIYIQDAQLESGLVSTDVISTTTTSVSAGILEDMPRLDYSGSCPSLLLEPQRTNLFDHSEYFNVWSNAGTTPVFTNNYGTSPEGLQNSTRVQLDNSDIFYKQIGSSQGAYVFSVFAKAISGGNSQIILRVDVPASIRAVFDLSDGTIVTSTSDGADIIDYENGWYRCILIQNNDTIVNAVIEEYSDSLDCEMYGAQLEQGSYPTSYIPTYGTSQTRSFDNMNSQSIVGDLSNNYTFFFDGVRLLDGDGTQRWFYTTGLNGTNFQIYFISGGSDGRLRLFFRAAGSSSDANITWEDGPRQGIRYKMAIVRSEGSLKLFADGSLIGENTSNVPDELTYYNVFAGNGAQRLNQYLIFPTALTDSECIALTSI